MKQTYAETTFGELEEFACETFKYNGELWNKRYDENGLINAVNTQLHTSLFASRYKLFSPDEVVEMLEFPSFEDLEVGDHFSGYVDKDGVHECVKIVEIEYRSFEDDLLHANAVSKDTGKLVWCADDTNVTFIES